MTKLSRMQRNLWVWTVPLVLGMVVCGALVCGQSLLVAQEQEPGRDGKHRVILPTEVQPGDGAGASRPSFGGSGGGMGGMGGVGEPKVFIEWRKPQGEKPDWLIRGEKAIRAREKMRRLLEQEDDFMFNSQPLHSVVTSISERYGLEIHIDQKALEAENLTSEEPITIKTKGSLRSCLLRILDPLNLAYVVHEDYLEITAKKTSSYAVRAYNITHVASNSLEGVEIVNTIKKMIQPDQWQEAGGVGACHLIGSALLVKVSEGMHEDIERLLAQLNVMRTDEKNP